MIFRVAADLFLPGAARATDLLALLRNAATRGHTLWVVERPDSAGVEESPALDRWAESLNAPFDLEVGWLRNCLRRLSPHAVSRDAVVIMVGRPPPPPASGRTD